MEEKVKRVRKIAVVVGVVERLENRISYLIDLFHAEIKQVVKLCDYYEEKENGREMRKNEECRLIIYDEVS